MIFPVMDNFVFAARAHRSIQNNQKMIRISKAIPAVVFFGLTSCLACAGESAKPADFPVAVNKIFSTASSPSKGTLAALWYAEGPNTLYADGVLSSWISADPKALPAVLHSTLFNGADPRPIIQRKGIYFNNQTGLQVDSGILAKTDKFAIHYVFEIGVTATYATKAEMLAAGGHVEGDIAEVTSDTNTIYTPDISKVFDGGYNDASFVNGYWSYNAGAWSANSPTAVPLWSFQAPDGKFLSCYVNRLGQITVYLVGPQGAASVQSVATKVIGNGLHQMSIFRDASGLRMYLDGHERMSVPAVGISITNLDRFYINGSSRGINPAIPVQGLRHWIKALAIVDDCTWEGFAASYDAIASYAGTPCRDAVPEAWGVIKTGQSLSMGSTEIPADTKWAWTTQSGWNGKIARENPEHSGEQCALTREFLPHVYAHASENSNNDIGPLSILTNSHGSYTGGHKTGNNESVDFGLFKWLINYPGAPKVDWITTAVTSTGNHALLTGRSTPPFPVHDLKAQNAASLTAYEKLLQSIICARDFAIVRGQRYKVKFYVCHQGFAQPSSAQFIAFYDQLNADIKLITGQTDDLTAFVPQINVSGDGVSNSASITQDQAVLDTIDNRGERPIYCIGPMYQIDNFVHFYRAGYRWIGEIFGKVASKVLFDGIRDWQPVRPKTFTLGANCVDIQYYLMPGRRLQFVDRNANNIDHRINVDGIDTYGFEYSGGGLTITAAPTIRTTTTADDTIRVPLSGVPAAGHIISYVKANSRFGNLVDDDPAIAYYHDQDWTQPLVNGSPVYKEGLLHDLRNWACVFSHKL